MVDIHVLSQNPEFCFYNIQYLLLYIPLALMDIIGSVTDIVGFIQPNKSTVYITFENIHTLLKIIV